MNTEQVASERARQQIFGTLDRLAQSWREMRRVVGEMSTDNVAVAELDGQYARARGQIIDAPQNADGVRAAEATLSDFVKRRAHDVVEHDRYVARVRAATEGYKQGLLAGGPSRPSRVATLVAARPAFVAAVDDALIAAGDAYDDAEALERALSRIDVAIASFQEAVQAERRAARQRAAEIDAIPPETAVLATAFERLPAPLKIQSRRRDTTPLRAGTAPLSDSKGI